MKQLYYTLCTLLRGHSATGIKLVSLSLGLLVGILLFSQIAYELSFDKFYPDADRLVLLRTRVVRNGVPDPDYNQGTYRPAAADLWSVMPDLVESATRCSDFWQPTLYMDGKELGDVHVMYGDTLYFRTLGLEVLRGDPKELASIHNAFLTQSMARRLFGDEDPIGKELSVEKNFNVTVRGIYRDVPGNTIFPQDILLSVEVIDWGYGRSTWGMNNLYYTLFRLKSADAVEAMNSRVQHAVEQFTDPHLGPDTVEQYDVIPVGDVHTDIPDTARRLVILGVLGFSIFFVSILNYVLASVASMSRRAKAVGVHKCCGAGWGHVMGMFLWETGVLVTAACVCSLLLMLLFRERIEELLNSSLGDLFVWHNLYVPLLTVLLLFLVAGVLPGQMYARIPVTQVFRRYTDGKRSWKRGLLFIQFAGVAFILGLLLTVMYEYHSLMNRSVGFDTERLVVGQVTGSLERVDGMADALKRQPYVEAVACASHKLLQHYSSNRLTDAQGNFIRPLHFILMDKEFPQVVGMKLIEGKLPQHKGESLVGRETVKTLHWEGKAIGQQLPVNISWAGLDGPSIVVGVVEDVRNMGFFSEQTCTAFIVNDRERTFNVRLKAPVDDNLRRLNAFVKDTYPNLSVEFVTYTDVRREMNLSVYNFRNVVWVTSLCIVLIVLMGLIGYVSDETQRRSKEIAIRKVNGAEASSILRLLSAGILKVAVGAVAIGIASAWYVSGVWMQQFADSVLLSPFWFLLLGLGILALIVLVVTVRAWRIANENPVRSIKSE